MSDFREPYKLDTPTMDCPLCWTKDAMRYKHVKDKDSSYGTHVWVCSCCPAVLFEYWDPQDVENVRQELVH